MASASASRRSPTSIVARLKPRFSLRVLLVATVLIGVATGLVIRFARGYVATLQLHDAIYFEDDHLVQKLVDAGADVNSDLGVHGGWTPLQRASACRNAKVVKILIKAGADVDATIEGNETTPLHWSVQDGNPDIAELLLNAGADPNSIDNGWTALDSLFGHRFVGRLRSLSPREFLRFEKLLINHGGRETLDRSQEAKRDARTFSDGGAL